MLTLVLLVLSGDIVFWNLARGHLRNVRILGVFYSLDGIRFISIPLLSQFLYALGIRFGVIRQLLNSARLPR